MEFDPNQYFEYVKSKKNKSSEKYLNDFYDIIETQLKKAITINQNNMARKLAFALKIVEKEYELLKLGIDTFVYLEDIEEFITSVNNKVVKIIDLEYYPRVIPDTITERLIELKEKNLFDNYYIVFTDYTDNLGKEIEKERRRKDPILFGAFEKKIDGIWDIHDRMYYIGDWEDEYCDLTLSKMIEVMSKKGKEITRSTLNLPTKEEVNSYINSLEEKERNRMILRPRKKSFFEKVKIAIKTLVE